MRIPLHAIAVASGFAVLLTGALAQSPPPGYFGIPAGFDYPADKQKLEDYRKKEDVSALRRHSWMLFAGMTQLTPDNTPYWETWFRKSETFKVGPGPQGSRRIIREFSTPRQMKPTGLSPHAPGNSTMTHVLFNWESFKHIRDNGLHLQAKLKQINDGFPAVTPWDKRKIPDFPAPAVSLKTIWWPVKGGEKTALPVWDNDTSNPEAGHHWRSWKRVVAVDATRQDVPAGETTTVPFMGIPRPKSKVVGLNRFYVVPVTAATLGPINQAIQSRDADLRLAIRMALERDLQVGDFILFIGTHVTSKEIDDWTWATFWWHDEPDAGRFAQNRPDEVKGVWRNYVMAIADDQVKPLESDGSPLIGYNPWLEGGFGNGIVSNCMTCHRRASYPFTSFLPVTRGLPNPDTDPAFTPPGDPAFKPGRLQLDFLWSVSK